MKIKEGKLEERVYSLMIGEDLEMISEKGKIMVLDRGIIVCITDNWIDAIDYIEQQYANNQKIMVDKGLENSVQQNRKINLIKLGGILYGKNL